MRLPARPLPVRLIDVLVMLLVMVYVWRIQDMFPILAAVKLPIVVSLAGASILSEKM